jgi:hypothetical protein
MVYVYNTNGKKAFRNSQLVVRSDFFGKRKHFLKSDCVFSKYLNTYIFNDSARDAFLESSKINAVVIHIKMINTFFSRNQSGDYIKISGMDIHDPESYKRLQRQPKPKPSPSSKKLDSVEEIFKTIDGMKMKSSFNNVFDILENVKFNSETSNEEAFNPYVEAEMHNVRPPRNSGPRRVRPDEPEQPREQHMSSSRLRFTGEIPIPTISRETDDREPLNTRVRRETRPSINYGTGQPLNSDVQEISIDDLWNVVQHTPSVAPVNEPIIEQTEDLNQENRMLDEWTNILNTPTPRRFIPNRYGISQRNISERYQNTDNEQPVTEQPTVDNGDETRTQERPVTPNSSRNVYVSPGVYYDVVSDAYRITSNSSYGSVGHISVENQYINTSGQQVTEQPIVDNSNDAQTQERPITSGYNPEFTITMVDRSNYIIQRNTDPVSSVENPNSAASVNVPITDLPSQRPIITATQREPSNTPRTRPPSNSIWSEIADDLNDL